MKPSTLIAWENGPTGGVSSGEVIAILLMANSFGYWVWLLGVVTGLDGRNGGARGCARFQGLVGLSGILERKALIDVNTRLSRSHHIEQLLSGSFKRIASLYVVEEDWARQKQRTLLRQQNGRNGIDGTGGLPERHHQSARS